MALASAALTFTSAVVAAPGTSVSPGTAAPDNCHTILVTNPDAVNTLLVAIGTPGGALAAGAAQRIGPEQTLTLGVGTLMDRGFLDPVGLAASGLIFDAVGGAITAELTYLNRLGGP